MDPIKELIAKEIRRQKYTISLIASENVASDAVLDALGSRLSDKYAEGYPEARYYAGCIEVDKIEAYAIEKLCKLFKSNYANVQPHSGSQANQAIFSAFLNPGDTILSLELHNGGHLTHGFKAGNTGKLYNIVHYHIHNGWLDMNEIQELANEHKPHMIIAGASSYSRIINWAKFKEICDSVGSLMLADIAHYAGLIVAEEYPNPIEYADFMTFTTHKTMRGPRGGGIVWNKTEYSTKINRSVFPGVQGGPCMHTIAAKAIAFDEALEDSFKIYARQIILNSRTLCKELQQKGWSILSDGTDCHMFVADLRPFNILGKDAQNRLDAQGITTSSNSLPGDGRIDSGIRFGVAAITSRGAQEEEMIALADIIHKIVVESKHCSNEVQSLALKLPLR